MFDGHGWELADSWVPEDHWVAEIWIIKSKWSPTDCFVTMNYVVDPQWTDKNNKHLGVQAIALALTKSRYTQNGLEVDSDAKIEFYNRESAQIYIHPNWERKFPELFEELSNLRQKFHNLKKNEKAI